MRVVRKLLLTQTKPTGLGLPHESARVDPMVAPQFSPGGPVTSKADSQPDKNQLIPNPASPTTPAPASRTHPRVVGVARVVDVAAVDVALVLARTEDLLHCRLPPHSCATQIEKKIPADGAASWAVGRGQRGRRGAV